MEQQKVKVFSVEESDESVKMDLLNLDESAVFELTLFKKTYENQEWIDNEDVTKKYHNDLQFFFGELEDSEFDLEFDFDSLIDKEFEVYVNEETGRAYIEEPKSLNVTKPTLEQVGDIESGEIAEIVDFDTKRIVIVDVDGVRYPVNFSYGQYHKKLEKYLVAKVKEIKMHARFKELTGKDWDDKDSVIGKKAMIEIKKFKSGTDEIPFVELKKLK